MAGPKKKFRAVAGVLLLAGLAFFFHSQWKNGLFSTSPDFESELAGLSRGGTKVADSTMDTMNTKARSAINKGDYQLGIKIVDALSKVNDLSPEQAVSLRNTVQMIKVQMAEAALGGDTNAEKALAYFKSSSVLGR